MTVEKEISNILLKQLSDESLQCFMWLISAINRSLIDNEKQSLFSFQKELKIINPELFQVLYKELKLKDIKIIK
jgi:hypothetical protein